MFAILRRVYAYDHTDLQARIEKTEQTEHWRREKVSFSAAYGNERVIAQVLLPLNAAPPYQTVIWFGGADVPQLPSSDTPGTPFYFDFLVGSGRAVVLPVFQGTYERRDAGRGGVSNDRRTNTARDFAIARFRDLGRTLDYLETRQDIDRRHLAYYGFSLGATQGVIDVALENRIATAVLLSGSLSSQAASPEVDLSNFAPRVRVPVLMLNGREDFGAPVESSQKPLFALLGTPTGQKQHIVLDGGHAPPRMEVVRHILEWLDRYLGPVSMRQ